jgi:hypothetical protein
MNIVGSFPKTHYWATESEPEQLASYVLDKVRTYTDHLHRSGLLSRIRRSWKYYHNLFYEEPDGEREIRQLGEREDQKVAGLAVNHTRNLLQHLLTLATQNPPSYDVLAANTGAKAIKQARLADQLLQRYRRTHEVGKYYKHAVENALVCTAGYVETTWDWQQGPVEFQDPITSEPVLGGDLKWESPSFWDVAYDFRVKDWADQRWVVVRKYCNRWELAGRYPELSDYVINWEMDRDLHYSFFEIDREINATDTDVVPVYEFWHKPTEALPQGRYSRILGDRVLEDNAFPYDDLPVDRVITGEFLGLCHGYTPAFDLQGLQEALNGEVSTILNNHKTLGGGLVWTPTASNVQVDTIREGLTLLESDVEPKAIRLLDTPPELFTFISVLMLHMELISGINSVVRGQPDASLKSGRALALIASQATQFASPLIQSYTELQARNATKAIRLLRRFAMAPRMIALTGKRQQHFVSSFTGSEDLDLVDQVLVDPGNAMSRTLAGRIEMADRLLDRGFLRNRDEYITVITTGQLDAMLEADEAQISLVRDENERLLQGIGHQALVTDYHVLHIKEHQALLSTADVRGDPLVANMVLGATMEHLSMLLSPAIQIIQTALGFPTQVPPVPELSMAMQQGPQGGQPGEPGAPMRAGAPGGLEPTPMAPQAQAEAMPFTSAGEAGG